MLLQAFHHCESVVEVLTDNLDQIVVPLRLLDQQSIEAPLSIDLDRVLVLILSEYLRNLSLDCEQFPAVELVDHLIVPRGLV